MEGQYLQPQKGMELFQTHRQRLLSQPPFHSLSLSFFFFLFGFVSFQHILGTNQLYKRYHC